MLHYKICIGLLLTITVMQWILISYLIHERHIMQTDNHKTDGMNLDMESTSKERNVLQESLRKESTVANPPQKQQELEGVVSMIFFSGPAWFHRRYPLLIQNALINAPSPQWAVQLFVNPKFWNEQVLPLHRGLESLLDKYKDRIIITEIPADLQKLKQPNQRLLLTEWFWTSLAHDRVLLVSGNGVLCTHGATPQNWQILLSQVDYVGVPWSRFHGEGGDGGTHSYRNRPTMLQALQYAQQHNWKAEPPESAFFVSTLQKMRLDAQHEVKLATPAQTQMFGGVQTTNSTVMGHHRPIPPPPIAVSGTQAALSFQEREDLLLVCPELKVIFPSLHEPTCFGAHPNAAACRATICALRDPLPASGC